MPSTGYEQFKTTPSKKAYAHLAARIDQLKEAQIAVERCELDLTKAKDAERDLRERILPEMMDEMGMTEFKTDTGIRVKIQTIIRASIPADKRAAAMQWLEDNGFGDIIKSSVAVPFTRGDVELAEELEEYLRDQGYTVESGRKVEPSTLRAFIGEKLREGETLPLEMFGAFEQRTAKITLPKE